MTIDEQIAQFADLLRKLTVEYDIFFSGGRKLPPTTMRFKVDNLIKRLLEEQMSYSQKFKYNQLVAKYSLYRDLWRRKAQDMEEGGTLRPEKEIESLVHGRRAALGEDELPPDRLSMVIQNPVTEVAQVESLYRNIQDMRSRYGEKPLDLDLGQFIRLIQIKSAEMRAGRENNPVEFVVYHDPQQQRVRFVVRSGESEKPAGDPSDSRKGSVKP